MGKVRYIHGWEEQLEYGLYPTEIKALNAFNIGNDIDRKQSSWDETKAKVIFRKGWECINCLKIQNKKSDTIRCCNIKYPQEEDKPGTYDVIGNWKKKLNVKDKEGEKK